MSVANRGGCIPAPIAPRPDASGVYMDKAGARIKTDAAFVQGKRGVTQRDGGDAGDADINRVRLHVQAVLGYACRT